MSTSKHREQSLPGSFPREASVPVDAPTHVESDVKASQLRNKRTPEEIKAYKSKIASPNKMQKIKTTLLKDLNEKDKDFYYKVICRAALTNDQVDKIQSGKITLSDDTKLFYEDTQYSVSGVEPSPYYPEEKPVNGAPVNQIRPFNLKDMPIYLAGPPVSTPFFKTVRPLTDEEANPHINTSLLKRTVPVIIAQNNLCACSLAEHPWLTHKSDGPVVITCVFDTELLVREIKNLRRCHLPILAVTQQYPEGLHVGNMYTFLCDSEGRTFGFSRGSDHTWWDLSDPIPEGNYFGYRVTTIASYGNQRLRLFIPAEPEELQTIEPTPVVPIPEQCLTTTPRIRFQPTPTKFLLGTFIRKHINQKRANAVIDESQYTSPISKVTVIKDYAYYVDHLTSRLKYYLTPHPLWPLYILVDLVWTLSLISNIWYFSTRAINLIIMLYLSTVFLTTRHPNILAVIATIILLVNLVINLVTYFSSPIIIILNLVYVLTLYIGPRHRMYRIHLIRQKMFLHGEYATEFHDFIKYNSHDPNTGLPYGWYTVIGRDLIQVAQYEQCEYTNLLQAIKLFCESKRYRPSSYVALYQSIFTTTTIDWDLPNVMLAFESVQSKIAEITSSVDYQVNVTDQDRRLNLKFLTEEDYSNYLVSAINEKTMAGSFSNRLGRGGVKPIYTKEEFSRMIDNFWSTFTNKTKIETLDPQAHIDHYSGAKRRKYDNADDRLGGSSHKPFYTSFAKIEPLPEENLHKKAVRIITMNTPVFNTYAKNFFEAFEHLVLSFTHNDKRLFAKGMNYDSRYLTILSNMRNYNYYTPLDFKNFDAHHVGPAYEAEINKYVSLGFNRDAGKQLIEAPIRGAFDFRLPCRHSGDLFTGSGNCLIVGTIFSPFFSPDFTIFCDGDDTILFYNDPDILPKIEVHIRKWGHEVDPLLAYPTNHADKFNVTFCQLEYFRDGYLINLARYINKMANISVSNVDAATRTMMGKLQSLYMLRMLGVKFSGSLKFLSKFRPDPNLEYKLENMGDLKYYKKPFIEERFDTSPESSSTLGKIINKLNSDIRLKLCPTDKTYRKRCYNVIKTVIQSDLDVQDAPQLSMQEMQEKVEYIVRNSGLKPILKELVHILSMPTTSQNGLLAIVDCTKPTECTVSESIGPQDTQSSQEVTSTCHIIPILPNPETPLPSKAFSPNKTQADPKSPQTDNSPSQPVLTSNNQTEDNAQDRTHTSSTLDTTSQQAHSMTNQSQVPSPSGSSTTAPSTHHKVVPVPPPQEIPQPSATKTTKSFTIPQTLSRTMAKDLKSQASSTTSTTKARQQMAVSTPEPHIPLKTAQPLYQLKQVPQETPQSLPLSQEMPSPSTTPVVPPADSSLSNQVPLPPISLPTVLSSQSLRSRQRTNSTPSCTLLKRPASCPASTPVTGFNTNGAFRTLLRRANALRRKSKASNSKPILDQNYYSALSEVT